MCKMREGRREHFDLDWCVRSARKKPKFYPSPFPGEESALKDRHNSILQEGYNNNSSIGFYPPVNVTLCTNV